MSAPNGTLYEFDIGAGGNGGSGAWGSINLTTGAFTQIGNLNNDLSSALPFTETYGYSFAFGPSGTLYATGADPSNNGSMDFGTLNLTTGAFTKIGSSPVQYGGSIASPTPEPGTLALLAAGAVGLVGYGLRRRMKRRASLRGVDDAPAVLFFASRTFASESQRRAA